MSASTCGHKHDMFRSVVWAMGHGQMLQLKKGRISSVILCCYINLKAVGTKSEFHRFTTESGAFFDCLLKTKCRLAAIAYWSHI